MPCTLTVKEGALYIASDVYSQFFAGLESVILLRREDDLYVLPVRHAGAGGYLLKIRNSVGDRVVNAPDFFREQGLSDLSSCELSAAWSDRHGALVAVNAFGL